MSSIFPRGEGGTLQVAVQAGDKRVTGSLATKDRKRAFRASERLQDLSDALKDKETRHNVAQITRLIGNVFDALALPCPLDPKSGPQVKFSEFSKRWLDRKHRDAKMQTLNSAKLAIGDFQGFADDRRMSDYTGDTIQKWSDALLSNGYAPNTINVRVSIVKSIFRHAQALGIVPINPAADIEMVKSKGVVNRQEFPQDAFDRVFRHLDLMDGDGYRAWRSAIMLGRYAGLRLRDAVRVKFSDFDAEKGILCYTALKTGRQVCVPVFGDLREYLTKSQNRFGEEDFTYFCEGLQDKKASVLSMQFAKIIESSGVTNDKTKVASGRAFNALSFHGLRHARSSELARLGIPLELRMKLLDHSTKRSAAQYDHSSAAEMSGILAPYFK